MSYLPYMLIRGKLVFRIYAALEARTMGTGLHVLFFPRFLTVLVITQNNSSNQGKLDYVYTLSLLSF